MPVTSFIPKKSVFPFKKDEASPLYKKSIDILIVASVIIFVLALIATGGLFLYTGAIKSNIAELSESLKRAEAQFEAPLLAELKSTGEAIEAVKKILANHKAPSRVFEFLEKNTHEQVSFGSISLNDGLVLLVGSAASYTALAEQSFIFKEAPEVQGLEISGVTLGAAGQISFSAKISIKPEFLNYRPR